MGNMGAFITITGNNLKPNYRSFEAVVSIIATNPSMYALIIIIYILFTATS